MDDLDNLLSTGSLDRLGPALSAHAMFPDGANIEFVEVKGGSSPLPFSSNS